VSEFGGRITREPVELIAVVVPQDGKGAAGFMDGFEYMTTPSTCSKAFLTTSVIPRNTTCPSVFATFKLT